MDWRPSVLMLQSSEGILEYSGVQELN